MATEEQFDADEYVYSSPALWLAAIVALLVGALLAAGLLFAVEAMGSDRSAVSSSASAPAGAPGSSTPGSASPSGPVCRSLVPMADRGFVHAAAMEQALLDFNKIMNDFSAGRVSSTVVLNRGGPALARGARESALFDAAYGEYANAVKACGLK